MRRRDLAWLAAFTDPFACLRRPVCDVIGSRRIILKDDDIPLPWRGVDRLAHAKDACLPCEAIFSPFAHARTVLPRCQALLLGTPFGEAALAVIQLGHSAATEQRFICEVGDHSPGGLSIGECRNSGLARPRTPTARRTRPLLHDQPRAVGGHLHANPILFRTLSNPESWNVASWPTPGQSDTLIFSWAPSGSDRRSPTASPL